MLLTVDLDRLRLSPGDRLLDAGCGEGRHCFGALERGARVVGLDLDREGPLVGGVVGRAGDANPGAVGAGRLAAAGDRHVEGQRIELALGDQPEGPGPPLRGRRLGRSAGVREDEGEEHESQGDRSATLDALEHGVDSARDNAMCRPSH